MESSLKSLHPDILADMGKRFSEICAEEFEKALFLLQPAPLADVLQLDQKIREMTGFFSKNQIMGFRSCFAKIFQIMTVLTIDKVTDIYDFLPFENSNIDTNMVKNILRLRSDFKEETIINLSI